MADVVLACDDSAIDQSSGDMVGEVGVQHWQDGNSAWDAANAGDQIDCRLKAAGEETSTSTSISLWER